VNDAPLSPEINRQIAGTDRYLTPLRAVEVFDAGRTYDNGNPPKTLSFGEHEVTNVRRTHAPGTVLGPRQKAWWKVSMEASDATWKVWGHSVPTLPMRLDLLRSSRLDETVHRVETNRDQLETRYL
jgi:alkaline phosphatase D